MYCMSIMSLPRDPLGWQRRFMQSQKDLDAYQGNQNKGQNPKNGRMRSSIYPPSLVNRILTFSSSELASLVWSLLGKRVRAVGKLFLSLRDGEPRTGTPGVS